MGKRQRPREYEFNQDTKLLALRDHNFSCARCGKHKKDTPEQYLEMHHQIYVQFAIETGIPAWVISHVENCVPLCVFCHVLTHKEYLDKPPKEVVIKVLERTGLRVRENV